MGEAIAACKQAAQTQHNAGSRKRLHWSFDIPPDGRAHGRFWPIGHEDLRDSLNFLTRRIKCYLTHRAS
jgi:hypothetical protein